MTQLNQMKIVNASVVSEQNGKSRLVLTSAQTGYTYRQNFTDTSGLLSALGVSTSRNLQV